MDAFDRDVVLFLLKWAPYGGPREEDAFCEFGLTTSALYERLSAIIVSGLTRSASLSNPERLLLTRAWVHRPRAKRQPVLGARVNELVETPAVDPASPTRPVITAIDRRLLLYVLAWAKFDGPPEDEALSEFGMDVPALQQRFLEVVTWGCDHESALSRDDRALLYRSQVHLGWHTIHSI